jgi:hypothetical protein
VKPESSTKKKNVLLFDVHNNLAATRGGGSVFVHVVAGSKEDVW